MVTLYVVSAEGATGKTTVCAALGKHFQGIGKKVGYLKPLSDSAQDGDAAFMKRALVLEESAESLCPSPKGLKEAYDSISRGKEVVIVEDSISEATYGLARDLQAKVIIIAGYAGKPVLKIAESYRGFGSNLLGIVLNKAPVSQLKRAREEAAALCERTGVRLLGVLPEDRAMLTLTVSELAESIQGKMLNAAEKSGGLVENFMLGAMVVDSGPEYFGRKDNKAAVIRSDRPDMQLAALETSTSCLVLSGSSSPPIPNVMAKAIRKGVPVILTEKGTGEIIAAVEDALGKTRFHQDAKLSRLAELVRYYFDFKAIDEWAVG